MEPVKQLNEIVGGLVKSRGRDWPSARVALIRLGANGLGPLLLLYRQRCFRGLKDAKDFRSRARHVAVRSIALAIAAPLLLNPSIIGARLAVAISLFWLAVPCIYLITNIPNLWLFPEWQSRVVEVLEFQLAHHSLEQGAPYTRDEREGLYAILGECTKPGGDLYRPELARTILDALPEIADGQAVDWVRVLATEWREGELHPLISRAAQQILPVLEAIRDAERRGETLLRPSAISKTDSLVRPVRYRESASEDLLRPVDSEDQGTLHAS